MRLQALKVIASLLIAAVVGACGGGSPAAAPTGLKAVAQESSVILTWDSQPGVQYWVFYAPTLYAPTSNSNMDKWFNLIGGGVILNVTSPYTVTGLGNDESYAFTINGRVSGGPGGPAATTVQATPRAAGRDWVPGASAGTQDIRSLAYSGNFVGVGTGGSIVSSADASTWTSVASPTTSNLNGVAYFVTTTVSNNIISAISNYITVGDGGHIYFSSDALNWTARASGTTQNLNAISTDVVSNIVAVGAQGTIITSLDGGNTWAPAASVGTTNDLFSVTYASGAWYALGANGTMLRSTDAQTWTAIATGTTANLLSLTYGTSQSSTTAFTFVVVGSGGTMLTSGDGLSFTSVNLGITNTLHAVVFGSQFLVVGDGGVIYISNDAFTWTPVASGTTANLLTLGRGASMYVAAGAGGVNLSTR